MLSFEFQCVTKLVCGERASSKLPLELWDLGITNLMFLTDANLRKLDSTKRVLAILDAANKAEGYPSVAYEVFDEIPLESDIEVVNTITARCRELGVNGIVALGGGSVIDTAKGVAVSLSYDADDLLALQGFENIRRDMLPLVVIPTTAGTGSEVSIAAVVADHANTRKLSFSSFKLAPHVAIVDPLMTVSLPPRLTATTALDALAHAIEAFTSLQKNPVSDSFAHTAVKLLARNILTGCRRPQHIAARTKLAVGALNAGIAFSNSMVGIVHAIAHTLGGRCAVPHSQAIAMLLVPCMRYNAAHGVKGYGELLVDLDPELYISTPANDRDRMFILQIEHLLERLHEDFGVPLRLSELGLTMEQVVETAEESRYDGAAIYNKVEVTREGALEILRKIW